MQKDNGWRKQKQYKNSQRKTIGKTQKYRNEEIYAMQLKEKE